METETIASRNVVELLLQEQYNAEIDKRTREIYQPIDTPLLQLAIEQRRLVLHSTMLLLLSLEHYAGHSRVLLLYIASSLQMPVAWLAEHESQVARSLLQAAEEMNADKETRKKVGEMEERVGRLERENGELRARLGLGAGEGIGRTAEW